MQRPLTGLTAGLASLALSASALASSHREAPLIAQDPTADSTDVYAFLTPGINPGAGASINLIANYIPFQEPAGGPNYFEFADSVLYEIKVDNTGDARADVIFEFQFSTEIRNGGTFLYNTGAMDTADGPNRNVVQRYTVWRTDIDAQGNRNRRVIGRDLPTAPPNIGPRSNPDYAAAARTAVHDLGNGVRVFAGPRDEGFYLDINAIFDLLNVTRADGLGNGDGVDGTAGFNVSSIAIQVPVRMLTADGSEPVLGGDLGGPNAVLGVWTTASRRKNRALRRYADPQDFGPWIQVSRLGLPLVNEVVVPLEFKDQFNRTEPADDLQNIAGYVVDPELSRLLSALYGLQVPPPPRLDMVAVISFLPGLATSRDDLQPADLLRINVAIPPVGQNDAGYNSLGVIGGDLGGFPNGRRPGDDVVDILERVVGGGILAGPPYNAGLNAALNDAVNVNDVPYLNEFPWLGLPHQGFVHDHINEPNID
ncbi:MAG: DUF4331 domain-containing protein [bacterium]